MTSDRRKPAERRRDADEPVLPAVPDDERDVGWGDAPDGRRDAEWYRRERPPHHE
jgi:hypothetical protein